MRRSFDGGEQRDDKEKKPSYDQKPADLEKLRWQAAERDTFIKEAEQKTDALSKTLEKSITELRHSTRELIASMDYLFSETPETMKIWTPKKAKVEEVEMRAAQSRTKFIESAKRKVQENLQNRDLDHAEKMQTLGEIQSGLEEKIKLVYQLESDFLSSWQKDMQIGYEDGMRQAKGNYMGVREEKRASSSLKAIPEEETLEFTEQQESHSSIEKRHQDMVKQARKEYTEDKVITQKIP